MPSEEDKDYYLPGSEREALASFLDTQRDVLLRKIEGLDDATARKAPTASSLSLLGLVKHSAMWERRWFQIAAAGREFPDEWPAVKDEIEDADLKVDENDTVEHWVAYYREQIEESRAIAASMDLDAPSARPDLIECNLRYILFHMIEETARHAGHADIIRETLDGSRGI
jgi:uncharacterized damage-inducible protein DinB